MNKHGFIIICSFSVYAGIKKNYKKQVLCSFITATITKINDSGQKKTRSSVRVTLEISIKTVATTSGPVIMSHNGGQSRIIFVRLSSMSRRLMTEMMTRVKS